MKRMILFLGALTCLTSAVIAFPVESDDDVELFEPVNTNQEDPETADRVPSGRIPIFVIRTRNPFFGPFGSSGIPVGRTRPTFGEVAPQSDSSHFALDDILNSFFGPTLHGGGPDYEVDLDEEVEVQPVEAFAPSAPGACGLICQVMRQFQGQIATIEEEIREIRHKEQDRENEIDGGSKVEPEDEDDGVQRETYEEKVLPDGTVVRINRTVISDSDGDGSAFFFHSTSFHNVLTPGEDDKEVFETDEADKEVVETIDADKELVDVVETSNDKEDKEVESNDTEFEDADDTAEVPLLEYPEADIPEVITKEKVGRVVAKRSAEFGQQAESSFKPKFVQQRESEELILANPNNPPTLHDDTRVNEIIMENARRGGLIRIDPDSELIEENEFGEVVPLQALTSQIPELTMDIFGIDVAALFNQELGLFNEALEDSRHQRLGEEVVGSLNPGWGGRGSSRGWSSRFASGCVFGQDAEDQTWNKGTVH
eukprot:maker-scaffold578_size132436-snap-gene-0.30 protein:Tk11686 transcript:maker-scaffold578_size132436-snap-gene-0.30-mRNA-1 annotation:"suppressor protein srp40-like"